MMEVVFHVLVQRDLRVALRYYEEGGGAQLADRSYDDVLETVERIRGNPKRFHFIADGVRRASLTSFPYHLLYDELPGKARVFVLRYDRRHPGFGMSRR